MPQQRRFALALAALLIAAQPAAAGWLSEIGQIAATAGRSGGRFAGDLSEGLKDAARIVGDLPQGLQKGAVAAEALPDGAWRFRNAAGDTITATSAEGVRGALSGLSLAGQDLSFYLSADAAFAGAASLDAFPVNSKLYVVIEEASYPLLRHGSRESARLYAEVDSNVIVAMTNRQLFDETIWQLRRPLGKSGIRIASLDTAGPAFLPSVGILSADGLPQAESLNAAALATAFASIRGQTLIVTGRIDGDALHFTGISGGYGTVPVAGLLRAAERQDVNLLLLDGSTPKQPGGTTWLFQERGIDHIDTAMAKSSLGDFISALSKGQGRMEIATDWGDSGHFRLTASPARPEAPPASGAQSDTGIGEQALDFGAELAKSMAGHVVPQSTTASLNSRDTQWDLDNRFIPGIPASWQMLYGLSWVMGLLGYSQARWWWRLVTRTRSGALRMPWRLAYELGYWVVFTPLAGPIALLAVLLWSSLEQLFGLWRLLTWPFRRKRAGVRG